MVATPARQRQTIPQLRYRDTTRFKAGVDSGEYGSVSGVIDLSRLRGSAHESYVLSCDREPMTSQRRYSLSASGTGDGGAPYAGWGGGETAGRRVRHSGRMPLSLR